MLNQLQVSVGQPDARIAAEVDFLPDSNIQHTRLGPSALVVTARAVPAKPHAKQRFEVSVAVRNVGARATRQGRVGLETVSGTLRPSKATALIGPLAAGARRIIRFRFVAPRAEVVALSATVFATGVAGQKMLHLRIGRP